jgi:hypothetical protein
MNDNTTDWALEGMALSGKVVLQDTPFSPRTCKLVTLLEFPKQKIVKGK